MTEVENRAFARNPGIVPGVVFSFAAKPGGPLRPGEQFCCGEKPQVLWVEGGRRVARCRHCNQQWFDQGQIHDARSPWIGVDLDGTLASDTGGELWDAEGRPKIGRPVNEMVARIKRWIGEGRMVKIFTARAGSPAQVEAIRAWLARQGLPDLEVTNVKDFNMIELWDDRCVQVIRNSGRPATSPRHRSRLGARFAGRPGSDRQRSGLGLLFSLKQIFLTL